MPTKSRNRTAEAAERGRVLRAFELPTETDQAIRDARDYLDAGPMPRCTLVQALIWLVREGEKKIRKKEK